MISAASSGEGSTHLYSIGVEYCLVCKTLHLFTPCLLVIIQSIFTGGPENGKNALVSSQYLVNGSCWDVLSNLIKLISYLVHFAFISNLEVCARNNFSKTVGLIKKLCCCRYITMAVAISRSHPQRWKGFPSPLVMKRIDQKRVCWEKRTRTRAVKMRSKKAVLNFLQQQKTSFAEHGQFN